MLERAKRFAGIFFVLGISLVVWVTSLADWYALPQGILQDTLVKLTPPGEVPNQDILLVHCSAAELPGGDDVWEKALHLLLDNGAQAVGMTFFPENVSSSFYELAGKDARVFFARRIVTTVQGAELEPFPEASGGTTLQWAVHPYPPSSYGVYRTQFARVEVASRERPTLVTSLAHKVLGGQLYPATSFTLNFLDRPSVLPSLALKTILQSNITPEMIRGRCVLVGSERDFGVPGLRTPLGSDVSSMSLLRYNGYALENLLQGKELKAPGRLTVLACIVCSTMLVFLLCQFVPLSLSFWIVVLLAVFTLGLAWAAPFFLHLCIPTMEMILAQAATFLLVFLRRSRQEARLIRDLVLAKPLRMYQAFLPENVLDSSEYWNRITTMVNQTLNLKRTIFLETEPRGHRVREIASLNCSINDIDERRRDFQRTPYSAALESGELYRLPKPFLSQEDDDALEYLVPLRFAGRVLGFWALEMDSAHADRQADLSGSIAGFANEIGELLSRRNRHLRAKREGKKIWRKLFALSSGTGSMEKIYSGVNALEKRVLIMDSVFQTLGTATVLYDLFGRVIQINKRMSDILQKADIPPYRLSALDLAVRLTGESAQEVRSLLSDVVGSRRVRTMTITLEGWEDSPLFFTIRALETSRHDGEDPSYPFALYGILFELVDVSEIHELGRVKEQLIAEGNRFLRQGVETLSDACTLMDGDGPDALPSSRELLDRKNGLLDLLDRLNRYMGEDMLRFRTGAFPIDSYTVLLKALTTVEVDTVTKKVSIDTGDHIAVLVLAEQKTLQSMFEDMLTVLLGDAVTGGRVVVAWEESDAHLDIVLANSGFGMPDKEFQNLLAKESGASETFVRIREGRTKIRSWNGELTGTSELGRGTTFRLRLAKFWQDNNPLG